MGAADALAIAEPVGIAVVVGAAESLADAAVAVWLVAEASLVAEG
jgi:hypothetical protein